MVRYVEVWNCTLPQNTYLVDGLALCHGMHNSEYQKFLPYESDHSLNVMIVFYCVWNKILAIYDALQLI